MSFDKIKGYENKVEIKIVLCFWLWHFKALNLALKYFILQILFQPVCFWSGTCDRSFLAVALCERAGVSTAVQKWVNECSDEREKTFKEALFIVGVTRQSIYKLESLTMFLFPGTSSLKCFAKLTTSINFTENGLLF